MGEKLRIAYVVVMFPCYSETFVLREILELRRRGAEVTVFSLRNFSEKIVDREARPLVPRTVYSPYLLSVGLVRSNLYFLARRPRAYLGLLWLFATRLVWNPAALLKTLALFPKSVYFAWIVRREGIRRVHAHFVNYPGTAAYIISRLTGVPFSMTAHAHDIFQNQLLLCEKLSAAAKTFAISEFNRDFIVKKCPAAPVDRLDVVHCGLDFSSLPRREQAGPGGRFILSVGRLVAIKGMDTLLRAMGILRDRGISIKCLIVGDGPEKKRLERIVDDLSLGGLVEMAGERTPEEVLGIMARATVFVLPSRRSARKSGVMDGIPVSLMEAMAIGVPVISSPVSGIPELVRDGESGILSAPGDAAGLAAAIERLLADDALRERLARGGGERVRKDFDIRKNAESLLTVFGRGSK